MFIIDERILNTCFFLGEWSLSSVFLKNECQYPWFILVPRREGIQELYQLTQEERYVLMEEMNQLSLIVKDYFQVDKINLGALGNVVPQLHLHVVGRYVNDALWPQGIWQAVSESKPYEAVEGKKLLLDLKPIIERLYETELGINNSNC